MTAPRRRPLLLPLWAGLAVGLMVAGPAAAEPPKKKPTPQQIAKKKEAKQKLREAVRKQAEEAERKREEALKQAEAKKRQQEAARKETAAKLPAVPAAEKQQPKPDADARRSAGQLARVIDEQVDRKLRQANLTPAGQADDAEFLRRVTLDLAGVVPTADEARAFLDSRDPDKWAKLVDTLLASPRYGERMADLWLGQMMPKVSDNRRVQPQPLRDWLVKSFNDNKPWDEFARDVVTATGDSEENGAVIFTLANLAPDKLTDQVSRLFLGVRVECAQCHNHPFVDWKQDEYWAMASFFMKVRLEGARNPNQAAKTGKKIGVTEGRAGQFPKKNLPESAKFVPAKFLQGEKPTIGDADPARPVLAAWMTKKDNPFFARAMVNKVWAQLFGRGIVNPVDDMHEANVPTHPELLATLAEQFAGGGYDLKGLIRGLCTSQTYQRSGVLPAGVPAAKADELYARMPVKAMTPFQLFDSLTAVVGKPTQERGRGKGDGGKYRAQGPREQFNAFFTTSDAPDPAKYETGIPQVLRLMNSGMMNNTAQAVRALEPAGAAPAATVETLYLATLSRRPTADETRRLTQYVTGSADRPAAYGDVLWAILNSSEFCLNH